MRRHFQPEGCGLHVICFQPGETGARGPSGPFGLRRRQKMRFALLLLSVIIAGRAGAQTLSEGKQLIYYERYASARTVLEKAPGSPETTFWLAKAELGLRDTAAARAHFLSVPLAGDLGALARA